MHRATTIGIAVEVLGNGTGVGLQMTGIMNPLVGWIIIAISNAVGIFLIGYGVGKREPVINQPPVTPIISRKRKRLYSNHSITLMEIEEQMEFVHGHSDHSGLRAEMLDGVPINDLMKHNCTRCGKPRNERGDFVL